MNFFILALILHGLLFFKLYLSKNDTRIFPKKTNIIISFQEVKSFDLLNQTLNQAPEISTKKEIKEEKKEEKIVKKQEVIKKVEKANKFNSKKKIKKEGQTKEISNKKDYIEDLSFKKDSISQISNTNNILQDNKDGTYTALSNNSIKYKIIKEIQPVYPKQAENINYRKMVIVRAKFLVNEKGEIENISIIQSHKKLGFDDAVITALKKWKFSPIYYNNKIIKVYFQKEFIFDSKK